MSDAERGVRGNHTGSTAEPWITGVCHREASRRAPSARPAEPEVYATRRGAHPRQRTAFPGGASRGIPGPPCLGCPRALSRPPAAVFPRLRHMAWRRAGRRRAGPHGTCYTSLPAVGEHRGSPRPERYRLGKLSSSTGPFGAGVSPPPALCFSPLETQGVSRAPAGGRVVGRAGGSGQSVSSGNAKAPPRLRPCSKCSRGSGAASPGLCTRGARSPR